MVIMTLAATLYNGIVQKLKKKEFMFCILYWNQEESVDCGIEDVCFKQIAADFKFWQFPVPVFLMHWKVNWKLENKLLAPAAGGRYHMVLV